MYIDTHAHVNFFTFKDDVDEVLKSSLEQGVCVINVGSQYATSKRAVEIAQKYDGVYAVVGLHPIHLYSQHVDEEETSFDTREEQFDYQRYKELALQPKVVGIGECGLDYYRLPALSDPGQGGPEADHQRIKQKQREVFLEQIKLALETKKTLMIHSRDAYKDIIQIIESLSQKPKNIVIHSFIGSDTEAKQFVKLGCYVSFNGVITYKPSKEKKPGKSHPTLTNAVIETPLNQILLETDCPYLSPEPLRGSRNVPVNVKLVAQKIADLKHLDIGAVAEQTTKNARIAFNISVK